MRMLDESVKSIFAQCQLILITNNDWSYCMLPSNLLAPDINITLVYKTILHAEAYIKLLLDQIERGTFSKIFYENVSFQQHKESIKMTKKCASVFLVLSLIIGTVLCQTFQYSRGWTNGKRSEFPNSLGASNSGEERFTNGELRRLKMLVYGNVDEQPLLVHCDFVDKLRKLIHTDNYASKLRQEKGQNDDNY